MDFVFRRRYAGRLRAIIFDWAGTTVDYGSFAPVVAVRQVFERAGIVVDDRQARAPMGLPKRDHLHAVLQMEPIAEQWHQHYGRAWAENDVDELYGAFVPIQREVLPAHTRLIPGTPDVVAACRERGLRIGSTTGYSHDLMAVVLAEAERQGYRPDVCVCPEDVPAGRPHPWMCLQAAMQLGVYPMEAIVKVGDTVPDIEEGLNAGMWTIGVTDTGNELGLAPEEVAALDQRVLERHRAEIAGTLRRAGAHVVVPSVADLLPAVDEIMARLQSGARP